MASIGVLPPDIEPKATEHIPEMVALVERLIVNGVAYVVDGDVYFEVRRFPAYGALSGKNIEDLEAGARVDVDERKRDPLDFALWKAAKPGEPSWPSPWGPGRPGWHIECSALALRELDTTIDLHGGGSDLIFPHHECEAAQSESATGQLFVRHWMHQAMVRMDGEKMSKSLGNLVFVSDLLKTYDPRAIRLACVSHHYRDSWEYTDDLMPAAADRLDQWLQAADSASAGPEVLEAVRTALDDDLDSPGAVAAIDAAVARGSDPTSAAALLGLELRSEVADGRAQS
jgi:L-cysteine:1D-myo-inositol 2-amino-2-deoxy-alpha-D-glucopyranoside ligase